SGPDGEVETRFDLVVVADGIHSRTRDMLPVGAPQRTETGWGGWVVWTSAAAPASDTPHAPDEESDLIEELWGRGFLIGSYPAAGDVGTFVGGPDEDTAAGPARFADRIRTGLTRTTPRV